MSTTVVPFADPTARYRPLRSVPLPNMNMDSLLFEDPFAGGFQKAPDFLSIANLNGSQLPTLNFGSSTMGQMPQTTLNIPSLYGSSMANDMRPNALGAVVNPMGGGGAKPGFWNNYGSMITGGLSAAADLVGAYQGYKQLGVMRDSLNFQKDAFNKQYEMSKRDINDQLEQRQRNRVGTNPSRNMPVEEYMQKYGV